MENTKKRWRILITGRVQGVYFRKSTEEVAQKLGITGIIRNEHDGSVFVEAEGKPENLESFRNWCISGPPMARVDGIQVQEFDSLAHYEQFNIEH